MLSERIFALACSFIAIARKRLSGNMTNQQRRNGAACTLNTHDPSLVRSARALALCAAIVLPDEGYFTSLKMKDEFRCLIAALYGKTYANNKTVVLGTATAPDVALRCAFYGNAQLTSKEMHKGRERDADAFEFAVLFNDHVYLKPELQRTLG
jgi:hypothetical protein